MSAEPSPTTVQFTFDLDREGPTLEQLYYGRRTRIQPSTAEVHYWASPTGLRWYVVIIGQRIRQADGERSRTAGRLAYWPDTERRDEHLDSAPPWVRDIVAAAHRILEGNGWAMSR